MTSLIKKLSIALVAGVVSAVGFVVPAQAATIYPTATATGVIGTTGTNAYPITITATSVGSTANQVQIMIPSGWTFVSAPGMGSCSWLTISGVTPSNCLGDNSGGIVLFGVSVPSSTTVVVTIPANTLNVAAGRIFPVRFDIGGGSLTNVDQGVATLAGGVTNSTVTFNANNGSGAMADQSASTSTALSTNAFTRSGYTFAGWNTAADGSGTAYANGADYAFTSSTTLYAQWTSILATTGFDGKPYLYTSFALAIAGAALMLLSSRRKQSN